MRTTARMLPVIMALLGLGTTQVIAQQGQEGNMQMSLKDCITYGLTHHRSVNIANNNIEAAKQQAREQLAGYLPQVNVNAELDNNLKLQQNIIPAGAFGNAEEQRITFGSKYASTQSVQLDQKIIDISLLTGLQANKGYNRLSELDAENNKENLIYNISTSYYKILVAQRKLGLLNLNKEQFEKILKVTELQAAQGVTKKVDVKQVQVNLNNVLSQISTTENDLTLAKNTLKNNMGLRLTAELLLTDTARWLDNSPVLHNYGEFNYAGTISYQQQKTQIELYDINAKSIKNEIFPVLSAFGRYGANGFGANGIGDAYKPLLDYSAIGVKLSWSVFTGFRRDSRYKQAIIDRENAIENFTLNEQLQNLQFQNAGAAVGRAQSTIITNKSNMELASEVYQNTTLQYSQGIANLSDLLNAELNYREAQNNYINSLLDYYIADLDVRKSNGTLMESYNSL